MKKFIYLCGMMLLSLNMMAQIDLNDRNWDWNHAFQDEFVTSRSWDTIDWYSVPDSVWRGFPGQHVTHGNETQIYQYDHCIFDTENGWMRLVSEYDYDSLIPHHLYHLPRVAHGEFPNEFNKYDTLYYFSGEIDVISRKFRYGYFEIRCKLPQHKGTFPAFWLHSSNKNSPDRYYEEIDIFEHSRNLMHSYSGNPSIPPIQDTARVFTTGLYQNLTGLYPDSTESFARNYPLVPKISNNLSDWHTFSCEWMPDHVLWYLDGNLVNSFFDKNHIPCHEMTLKTNYAIDRFSVDHNTGQPLWFGSDEMVIDYILVYQLLWNCNTEETITSQTDLDTFNYAVKKSISITSTAGQPIVDSGDKVTFRVTDTFEVTGPFQINNGAEFTVIVQECPNNPNN